MTKEVLLVPSPGDGDNDLIFEASGGLSFQIQTNRFWRKLIILVLSKLQSSSVVRRQWPQKNEIKK